MHDPMTLAWTIRRPFPQIRKRTMTHRPPFRWRSSHWYIGRWTFYWPSIIDCWHVEPKGHDSGEVCKHYLPAGEVSSWKVWLLPWYRAGKSSEHDPNGASYVWDKRWKWTHWRHWSLRFIPYMTFNRWAFQRCEKCGGKSRRGHPVNVSHQWDGPRQRFGKSRPGLFHGDCSSIISLKRTIATDAEALAELFHLGRTLLDLSEEEMIARLYCKTGDFTAAFHRRRQIETALGWKFDHDGDLHDDSSYRLVHADGRSVEPYDIARAKGWMK